MKPQEAIGIMKIAISEVEWEYPMDYLVAMVFLYMTLGYAFAVVDTTNSIVAMTIYTVHNAGNRLTGLP